MKNRTVLMCGVFLLAATAWAGLYDPVLLNPSFEADVLAPATKTNAITDWWNRTNYCWASEETTSNYPLTPYGSNWVEFGNGSWVYQQIGTWEAGIAMEVSLLVGSVNTKTFPGVHVSLWVGGDPAAASDAGANDPTTLESAVVATQIAISGLIKPALTGAATSEESVVLTTGSDQTEGAPLWLLIQSAGAQRMLIDNIAVRQLPISPVFPPTDSETPVSVDAVLEWKLAPGYTVTGYDVWFGTDPNENLPNFGLTKIVDKELVTTRDPAPSLWTANLALDYGTDYSWMVDIYEPNAPGPDKLTEGVLLNFTTEPPEPEITGEPVGDTVLAGTSAVFTVETSNVEAWQWYKVGTGALSDDGKYSGVDTASLTVSSVDLNDEGSYYCVVSNTLLPPPDNEAQSDVVQLMTARLVGRWKLDGDLNDSVADEVTGAPIHDGTAIDPNHVAGGVDGNGAYEFFDDSRVVTIADSNDFFNFYPSGITVNAWTKIDAANSFATVLSKRNNVQDAGWMLRCPDTATFALEQATQVAADGQDSLADGEWHMITGQYDGSTVKVFVDGILADETNENTNIIGTHPEALVFGAARPDGGGPFLGLVDDISIWSYPLSPEKIAKIYANMTGESVCLEFPLYDFSENCVVDFADFVEIARIWQVSNLIEP